MKCAACSNEAPPGRKYCGCRWGQQRQAGLVSALDQLRRVRDMLWFNLQRDPVFIEYRDLCAKIDLAERKSEHT
jgi:hypothetical protein